MKISDKPSIPLFFQISLDMLAFPRLGIKANGPKFDIQDPFDLAINGAALCMHERKGPDLCIRKRIGEAGSCRHKSAPQGQDIVDKRDVLSWN